MKRTFMQPRVVVSKCIEFGHVRYNGDMISSNIVKNLKKFVEFIPVCPEVEIGLGIPRDPVRIVRMTDGDHLIQPVTGRDVTSDMNRFATAFLDELPGIDGFILKNRSPTSGVRDVKVYPSAGKSAPIDKTAGIFGKAILARFPYHPVEDEGRLRNIRIRDHFLTAIFTLADFRHAMEKGQVHDLVTFHTQNKYLLMAHNQLLTKKLGGIVADTSGPTVQKDFDVYREILLKTMHRPPQFTTNVNVLLHALGHFSDKISPGEKAFFLDALGLYHSGRTSVCAPKNIIKAWIVRFDDNTLGKQTFFAPFPDSLMELEPAEADRGRDFFD